MVALFSSIIHLGKKKKEEEGKKITTSNQLTSTNFF